MINNINDVLVVIPARGGSKGIPKKNIKVLGNKPLINYAIDEAKKIFSFDQICVSTDSTEIANCAKDNGLEIPFLRPEYLATDNAGSYEVLLQAVEYYKSIGKNFSTLILLQPTSPFRTSKHILEAMKLYNDELDMVVSVCVSDLNPYYNLFEEDSSGYLKLSKPSQIIRRQDCDPVYFYNGAIYIINIQSLISKNINMFTKVLKYEMDEISSIDIDKPLDWDWAEFILNKKLI